MKRAGSLLLLLSLLAASCVSGPDVPEPPAAQPAEPVSQPQPQAVTETPPEPVPPPAVEETPPEPPVEEVPAPEVFDPGSISHEQFETTKTEVQALIETLNRIIRARNYNAWTGHLAEPYFNVMRSQEFLEGKTEELYKRDQIVATNMGRDPRFVQKKILRTPKDYFDHVVVPSRSNDHVDDIDFVSKNRVKAYTFDTRGTRLVLYDLEIIDGVWKIIS